MSPLSHYYVSTLVTGKDSPLLTFGSILPDMCWCSPTQFSKNQIHYSPQAFSDFINTYHKSLSDLALGVTLHTKADFYSDDNAVGFAHKYAPHLVEQGPHLLSLIDSKLRIPIKWSFELHVASPIAKILNIPAKLSLFLAHNFIEAGVDLNLIKNFPQLHKKYLVSLDKAPHSKMINILSNYLGSSEQQTKTELTNYLSLIDLSKPTPENLSQNIQKLIEISLKSKLNTANIQQALNLSVQITSPIYKSVLDDAVSGIKKHFPYSPPPASS